MPKRCCRSCQSGSRFFSQVLTIEWNNHTARTIEDSRIEIPLAHFVDHAQIDRRLTEEARFCVEWAGEKLPLIRVSADPVPEILTFMSDPPTIVLGQEAVLRWATRNAQGVRVRIDPAIGYVESTGSIRVEPAASTHFTLRLMASGIDDVTKEVAVTVLMRPDSRHLMTPMQLLEKVVEMQHGVFLEYYRGFLGADTTEEANRLRRAAQYWEAEGDHYIGSRTHKSPATTHILQCARPMRLHGIALRMPVFSKSTTCRDAINVRCNKHSGLAGANSASL